MTQSLRNFGSGCRRETARSRASLPAEPLSRDLQRLDNPVEALAVAVQALYRDNAEEERRRVPGNDKSQVFRHRSPRFTGEFGDATQRSATSYRASLAALRPQMISGNALRAALGDFRLSLFPQYLLDALWRPRQKIGRAAGGGR